MLRSLPDGATARRWARFFYSHTANRQVVFTITALSILAAKAVHIQAHKSDLPSKILSRWAFSLYAQDLCAIILARILLDPRLSVDSFLLRFVLNIIVSFFIAFNATLAIVSVTFFAVTNSEIHWRNVGLVNDPSSRALVLSGTITFVYVIAILLFLGWLLQGLCFGFFGYAVDIVAGMLMPLRWIMQRLCQRHAQYSRIPRQDEESDDVSHADKPPVSDSSDDPSRGSRVVAFLSRGLHSLLLRIGVPIAIEKAGLLIRTMLRASVLALLLAINILAHRRPDETTLTFLSWTAAMLPFVDFSSSSTVLERIEPLFVKELQNSWNNLTALAPPLELSWIRSEKPLPGFEDWLDGIEHYNASIDPLRIPNLDESVLSPLKEALKDMTIRHVILVALESTRNDVFPIKKDGMIWKRIAEEHPGGKIPTDIEHTFANLTPTARYITGDYDDGFVNSSDQSQPKRGGIHFSNAYTTSTYTLKSLVGSVCGIMPLVADFNLDCSHHIYQPCLPHILEAMNQVNTSKVNASESGALAGSSWQSYFFQTATLQFDNFDQLMLKIGFPQNNTVDTVYLRSDEAKHGPVKIPDTNYFGFEEEPLEEYIRDAFKSAKEHNERVFLTQVTSTTHHPFVVPESTSKFTFSNSLDSLSDYVNSIGYVDKWLKKLLDILDEQGVAGETLVIFTGDHGLSIPENNQLPTYYNPNAANNHVPLVLSHPKLPAIKIEDPVSSIQILPTILDLLLETGSLDAASRKVASDLVSNYEGQSLIRPLQKSKPVTGEGNWQYTIVNPGRSMITVRDTREPDWQLVVPIVENVSWGLLNLRDSDPEHEDFLRAFDFKIFLKGVEATYGLQRAKWVEEAAFTVRWWSEDSKKRWRYGYSPEIQNSTYSRHNGSSNSTADHDS